MKNIRRWVTAFSSVIVLAIACGQVQGGGDSETNWLKACNSDGDCRGSGSCLCGVCTRRCTDGTDCALISSSSACVEPPESSSCGASVESAICTASCVESIECARGFTCQSNRCTPIAQGNAGQAGAPSFGGGGSGGASCIPDPGGVAGASSIFAMPPPPGAPCETADENLEICTYRTMRSGPTVLARCTNQRWETVEDPSQCAAPYQECNAPGAQTGVCCEVPRFCAALSANATPGYCDGKSWWLLPGGIGGGETGGTDKAGAGGKGPGSGGAGMGSGGGAGTGANCLPPDPNAQAGGAFSVPSKPPADGTPCPSERENVELCTGGGTTKVLSVCTSSGWETLENPSDCTPPYQECNVRGIANGVCCAGPKYCEGIGFCDGERWWIP